MSDFPYTVIKVSGEDALEFLQAQLAADLSVLDDEPILAAWCNPKGRVICLFRVLRDEAAFRLMLPSQLADAVTKRLAMFRFRSRVEFEIAEANPQQFGIDGDVESWRLENLRTGVPEIDAAQSEQWTPHMLNLDLLNAVSIDKGCYPGQEIVARTHYRGKSKRRCLRFTCSVPVLPGDKVSDGARDVGEVVNAIDRELLAVVPLDKQNQELTINGNALVNSPLAYIQ